MENHKQKNFDSTEDNSQKNPKGTNRPDEDPRKNEQVVNEGFSGSNTNNFKDSTKEDDSANPHFPDRAELSAADVISNHFQNDKDDDLNERDLKLEEESKAKKGPEL